MASGQPQGRAMVGRGSNKGQPQAHIDAAMKIQGLHRNQRLIMIHTENGIVGGAGLGVEGGICR